MKNGFDGPLSRLNKAEERISELKDIVIEFLKPKAKGTKDWRKK